MSLQVTPEKLQQVSQKINELQKKIAEVEMAAIEKNELENERRKLHLFCDLFSAYSKVCGNFSN